MRKRLSVIILVIFQLLLVVGLAVLNPVENYLIRTHGTLHTFRVESSYIYGDFNEFVGFSCAIDRATDGEEGKYATIATDENGISYISEIGYKPKSVDYLKNRMDTKYFYFSNFRYEINAEYYNRGLLLDTPLFNDYIMSFTDNYDITVKAWVHEGKAFTEGIYVDGEKLEDFIVSHQ